MRSTIGGNMRRLISFTFALTAAACSGGPSETARKAESAETFAGTWRSVTPSLEFVRLVVVSKSSEVGALGGRLTFSGVAWEGSGRIDSDSLVMEMYNAGTTQNV